MDLTATAFGLLVTALGGLFTAVVLLARRELDRGREQVADLGLRLAAVERRLQDLDPLAAVLRQKAKEQAERMLESASFAREGRP